MKHAQASETDNAREVLERLPIASFRCDVVAGGEQMTGVQADADAGGAEGQLDDSRELFEAPAERCPLTRRVLQQHHRLMRWTLSKHVRQSVGDAHQAV